MANKTFSELPFQSGIVGGAIIPYEYSGTTYQTTAAAIAALSSASPAGSTKQIQYNAAGAFGAEAGFEYDAATDTFSAANMTSTGLVLTAASATGGAGLRLPAGAAPTAPTNGDVWTTTAGLFARINGATVGPYGVAGAYTQSWVINAQTGTSYALVAGDVGKHVTLSNAAAISVTIAQAGTTGFADGYTTIVENIGVGNVTVTPATSTINGVANIVLNGGMSMWLFSDGTNYRAVIWERGSTLVNSQTGTSYTVLSTDRGKLISLSNASAIALTLPIATGAFGSGWSAWIQNTGVGTVTLTPTTSTIDGATNLALTTGQGVFVASDGTNYFTMRGRPSAASSLAYWTEAQSTAAPNGTINAASFTAVSAGASGSAIIAWKGTSGFLAVQVPDNTATGGNLRGAAAVDFQSSRSAATQVASGIRSGLLATQNAVANGTANSAAVASLNGISSGSQSLVQGNQTTATGDNSVVVGHYATDRGLQSFVQGSGTSTIGRRQRVGFVGYTISSFSAAARTLSTDGAAASGTNILILPNSSVFGFTARVLMLGGSDYWDWELKATCYRGANAAATVINGVATLITGTDIYKTAGVAGLGWAISAIADTTNGGIIIRTTGDTGQLVNSSCYVDTIQLTP